MDVFSQKKFFLRLTVFFALLNLCTICFVFITLKRDNPPPPLQPRQDRPPREAYRDVSGALKERLNLTSRQENQIDSLRISFIKKEMMIASQEKAKRDSMNTQMFNEYTDTAEVKKLAAGIALLEYQMELSRLDQARGLKAICTPQQLQKLNSLVIEIRDYFRPDNQPEGGPVPRR